MHAFRMALVGLIALTMGLAGCSGNPGDKEALGTILGAVGGGIAGSQVGKGRGKLVATGIGTLLGAAIGNEIGKSLDRADRSGHAADHATVAGKGKVRHHQHLEEPRLRQPGHHHPEKDL